MFVKYIFLTMVVSISILTANSNGAYIQAQGVFVKQDTPTNKNIALSLPTLDLKGLSLSLGIRYSSFDVKSDLSPFLLTNKALDDSSISYDLGIGYEINKNIFTTLLLQNSSLQSATLNNIQLSLNYIYPYTNYLNPYMGLIIGMSDLTWDKEPVKNSTYADKKDSKLIYGAQIGNEFLITNYIKLYLNHQYLQLNHKASINQQKSIKHNSQNNSSLGIKYVF